MKALAVLAVLNASLAHRTGDCSYRQREAAHRALAAMGASSLPFLERNQGHPCLEVRERVLRLLAPYAEAIDDRQAAALADFDMPSMWVWSPVKNSWVIDVEFERFDQKNDARAWIKSLILQRRPWEEIHNRIHVMKSLSRSQWHGR